MTERPHFHFSLSCAGEGNGNLLQCSCLENPTDGGAWWAAVYGVAQGRARLKRLSSSSKTYFVVFLPCRPNHSIMSDTFATLWTASHQPPLSMEFSRQDYWSNLPFSTLGDLPDQGNRTWVSCLGRWIFTT